MGDAAAPEGPDLIVCIEGRTAIRHAADGAFTIGRDRPPSDLSVEHPAVSRLHLRLIPGQQWCLVDYESLNGIYLDGLRIAHSAAITEGMTVHLANPAGIAVTFHYVHPEDITAPAVRSCAAAEALAAPVAEMTRHGRSITELRAVIGDVMRVPAVGDPQFARVTLSLLRRLVHLQDEFTALAGPGDQPEAAAYLTCVRAMYDGLLIRLSVCG